MSIHNDERFLACSLPSILRLQPTELILVFDRCTDQSLAVAKELTAGASVRTRFVEVTEENAWKSRFSFLRCLGVDLAAYDIVLKTDADVILDGKIREHLHRILKCPFVSFNYVEFPVNVQNVMQRLFAHLPAPFKGDKLAGVYVVNRQAMYECEDREELKELVAGEDTFLHYSIKQKYPTEFVITKSVHLRPRRSKARHYLKGQIYWTSGHRGFWKMAVVAVLTLRFSTIVGYIRERFGGDSA